MGQFINFYLPFLDEKGHVITAIDQAQQILDQAKILLGEGVAGVAISYSANYDQTVNIHKTYAAGDWNTHTSGSNQAAVVQCMEQLLGGAEASLATKMRIAPITTMTYNRVGNGYGGQTHREVILQDLAHIEALLEAGWAVLGWINQLSTPKYAVGGGVTNLDADLSALVQSTLAQYAERYGG